MAVGVSGNQIHVLGLVPHACAMAKGGDQAETSLLRFFLLSMSLMLSCCLCPVGLYSAASEITKDTKPLWSSCYNFPSTAQGEGQGPQSLA